MYKNAKQCLFNLKWKVICNTLIFKAQNVRMHMDKCK